MLVTNPLAPKTWSRELVRSVSSGWWVLLLSGIVSIVAGGIILLVDWSLNDLALFLGVLFIVRGVFNMLSLPLDGSTRGWAVALGLLEVGVGIAVLVWPDPTLLVIAAFIGWWAATQARDDLEKAVAESRASAEAQAAQLKESAAASKDKISGWWDEQQQAWNDHVAKVRQHVDEKRRDYDAVAAQNSADVAEADAEFAIDFAYSAIEEAESAVLDAILAHEDAEDALSRSGSSST